MSRLFDLGEKEHSILDSCFLDESKLPLLTVTVLERLFLASSSLYHGCPFLVCFYDFY